ncbi:MAG: multiple antibiotic resistance (MarC)-related protein [Bacteroidetes bacterium]|nr:multiple antibiotic resistance (MarC)-related protein [Bacteroidota bacterium]
MEFNFKEIATITMILFAVIDVVGSLPVLLDLQSKHGKIQSEKATLVSGVIMVVFMFIGQQILSLIGIDVSSFAIAGSFIIFFLALEMILGIKFYKEETAATASVVPIAFPLIAGTGTLTTLLSMRAEYKMENIIVAILINLVFIYVVLRNTYRLEHILGVGGINILRKVFGVILLAIAVKLFRTHAGI